MMYPDYQRVDNAGGQRALREVLGRDARQRSPGLTVVEIMDAACEGKIRGMYIMGENPAMSDPERAPRARGAREARAPGGAGHLPHRDRVPRRRRAAGVRVAREDRHRHQHRPHGAARAPRARHARATRARTCGSSSRSRERLGLRLELRGAGERRRRGLRGDAPGDELDRRHLVGAPRGAIVGHLSVPHRGRPRAAGRVHREFPDRRTGAASSCPPTSSPPTSAPTPSIRSCSSPGASSSTGTRAR